MPDTLCGHSESRYICEPMAIYLQRDPLVNPLVNRNPPSSSETRQIRDTHP